jgi:hypothetical protein
MRKFAFALGCAAALGFAAPAAAADVQAQDPQSVVGALQQAGYRAQLDQDDTGDPLIRSAASGSDFLIFFYNCTDNADCRTIQFYAGYSEPSGATVETMNVWNRENRFGRAYLGDDGIARIEMDVDLDDGGLSQALFEDNLEFWLAVMANFEEYVGY